ncbi:MAG: hypothetical protein M1814_004852 [Vezdaea aestivalis]|nr:MAG: hypothetical protein M1814_004852 [Vezdaea aestivalis]
MPRRRPLKLSPKHESQNTLTQLNFFNVDNGFPSFPIDSPPKTRPPVPLFQSPTEGRAVKRRLVPDSEDEDSEEDTSQDHPTHPSTRSSYSQQSVSKTHSDLPSSHTTCGPSPVCPHAPSSSSILSSPKAIGSSPPRGLYDNPSVKQQRKSRMNTSPGAQVPQQSYLTTENRPRSSRLGKRSRQQQHRTLRTREVPDTDDEEPLSDNEESLDSDEEDSGNRDSSSSEKDAVEERTSTSSCGETVSLSRRPLVEPKFRPLAKLKLWTDEDMLPSSLLNESIPEPPELSSDED